MWAKGDGIKLSAPASSRPPTTRPSISEHLRQRAAVTAHKGRNRVRIISQCFAGGEMKSATVCVGEDYYEVRPTDLSLLQQGRTPEWLGLEPIPENEEV
ncbi:hypothetical protein ACSBOB_11500 [Mesorhizobium sp. ASY16-5R]|uniref:hypothetical protein n=1 Tax=Mesorhizobium sp. ASY16-5R TaxID=3445772 RepID=UPI003FA131AE